MIIRISNQLFFSVTLFAITTLACEPCSSNLNLEQSLNKADLVIVGQKFINNDVSEERPTTSRIQVLRVLKGRLSDKQIVVRSWYGMCPYGIIIDDKTYLMILSKSKEMPGAYESIDSGCSVKTLPVKGDNVYVDGVTISLAKIKRKFKLKGAQIRD